MRERKSQKGRSANWQRYKYNGQLRKRKNRYSPRNRGPRSVKRVFHKSKIAVRTGDFYQVFEHKTSFNEVGDKWTQTRKGAKIEIKNFDKRKDKTAQTIEFKFYGTEGKSLRMLSYGRKREVPLKLASGKTLKGKKGRRDVVGRGLRATFNKWNKIVMAPELKAYKQRFDRAR